MPRPFSSFELLESRIAPALLFVSGTAAGASSLKVLDAAGGNAQDTAAENNAQAATGATAAVLLQAGDRLVFDRNGNHALDRGDRVMAEVTAGQALFFLKDGPTGAKRHAFELTELTGAAVSDGFAGSIHTDVNGSVVTALDAGGVLTLSGDNLQITNATIARLTIDGQIAARLTTVPTKSFGGHLLAGAGLSEVSVGGALFNRGAVAVSVAGAIGVGTAAAVIQNVTFDAGRTMLQTTYTPVDGENGGSIDHLLLRFGVGPRGIAAGAGDQPAGGPGGAGGSISHLQVEKQFSSLKVQAGRGGNGGAGGDGGLGGSILESSVTMAKQGPSLDLLGGPGGVSAEAAGGQGGALDHVRALAVRGVTHFELRAGNGGSTSAGGFAGGNGGDVTNVQATVKLLPSIAAGDGNFYTIRAGSGAPGASTAFEGSGGAIEHLTLVASGGSLRAGSGSVVAGADGAAFAGTGLGGSVRDANITLGGGNGSFSLATGGGVAGSGTLEDVHLMNGAFHGEIHASAGTINNVDFVNKAANVAAFNANAARVDGLSVTNSAPRLKALFVTSGSDGTPAPDISNLRLANSGTVSVVEINAGPLFARGGDIDGVSIVDTGKLGVLRPVEIRPGGPTDSGAVFPITGGGTGDLTNVTIDALRASFILGPDFGAGAGVQAGVNGGKGGDISQISGRAAKLQIEAARGGGSESGVGGAGGSISDVQFTITAKTAQTILAGGGGGSRTGQAGAGGSISGVHLTLGSGIAQMIAAGDGGVGVTPGAGGSISDVHVFGDLGDFKKRFGFSADAMGGLAVGRGGLTRGNESVSGPAGSINGVSADRIAAIVAGRPTFIVESGNAVESIANLSARVLGADTGIPGQHRALSPTGGTFDFDGGTDNAFTPGEDRPVDGLVIVKQSGVSTPLPVTPLKLILV